MSWIEDTIGKVEKRMQEAGITFDRRLKDLEGLSVKEDERIARERFESGWKDDLREMLGPVDEALKRGEGVQGLVSLLGDVVVALITRRARDAVSHHYFLQQIRLLEERLAKLEA
jgi:hypothetical protein